MKAHYVQPITYRDVRVHPSKAASLTHTDPLGRRDRDIISQKVLMDQASQEAMSIGTDFDKWLSSDEIQTIVQRSIKQGGAVAHVLKRHGFGGFKTQQFVEGRMDDVRFGGTYDLAFTDEHGQELYIPDTKVSGGREFVSQPATGAILIGTGKGRTNYGVQVQGYAFATGAKEVGITKINPQAAGEIRAHYDALSDHDREVYLAKVLEAYLVGGYNVADTGDLSPAVASGLAPIQTIQTARQARLSGDAFKPGGSIYHEYRGVAERDAVIEMLTGVSAEKLNSDQANPIPEVHKEQYAKLYAVASKMVDAVVTGQVLPSDAKRMVDRLQYSVHLPWDSTKVQGQRAKTAGVAEGPQGSITAAFGEEASDKLSKILGKSVRVEGGDVVVASETARSETTGLMPVAWHGKIGEFRGRPVLNNYLIAREQGADGKVREAKLLQEALLTFEKAGGGTLGAEKVKKLMMIKMQGMPWLDPNWQYVSSSGAQALLREAVHLTGVEDIQAWYAKSRQYNLVARGDDPSIGYDISKVISATAGGTAANGMVYTGESDEMKIEKRLQQALRRTGLMRAQNGRDRNVASLIQMEGADRVEFGIRLRRTAMTSVLPEGMGAVDADVMREMGHLELPYAHRIQINQGDIFQADSHPQLINGKLHLGTINGVPKTIDLKDFESFSMGGEPQVIIENGKQYIELVGVGYIDPASDTFKSWLSNKYMGMAYEGLSYGTRANGTLKEGSIEALIPMPKNIRQAAYAMLGGEYGAGQNARKSQKNLGALLKIFKDEAGIDLAESGHLRPYSKEEIQHAKSLGIALPSHKIIWDHSLDEAVEKVARKKYQSALRLGKNTRLNLSMSYEEAEMYARILGEDALQIGNNGGTLAQWREKRNENQTLNVGMTVPTAIMAVMQQFEHQSTGRASLSMEEAIDMVRSAGRQLDNGGFETSRYAQWVKEQFIPALGAKSGHTREYYEKLLDAQLATRGGMKLDESNVVSIEQVAVYFKDRNFHAALAQSRGSVEDTPLLKAIQGKMIRLEDGTIIPPLNTLAIMSVGSELRDVAGATHAYDGDDDKFPQEEHNSLIYSLENLVAENPGSAPAQRYARELSEKLDKLVRTKSVNKSIAAFNVTGSGGTEQPYVGTAGLRPWQVIMGRKALRDLFGTDDIEDINQRIAASENMALTQRRPSPLPELTSTTPMQILTPEMARAQGLHHISKNFNGIAFSQAAMDPKQGDFDGDRILAVLAASFGMGDMAKQMGLEGTKLEDAYLGKMRAALETMTGNTGKYLQGEFTWNTYLDAVTELRKTTGSNMSEVAKWMETVSADAPSMDKLIGKEGKFQSGLTIEQARDAYLQRQLYKKQMGMVMNRFTRNASVMMDGLSLSGDLAYQQTADRLRYFTYQASIDSPISAGLRRLIEISDSYTPRQDGAGGRLYGNIKHGLRTTMGEDEIEKVDFKHMPAEIIRATLLSTEMRGLGKDGALINESWADDIGRLLTANRGNAAKIADLIKASKLIGDPTDEREVRSVTTAILKEVYGDKAESFWVEPGVMPAIIGGHLAKRAERSGGGANYDMMFSDEYNRYEGGERQSGWGAIAELAKDMQAEQSFFSGRSGEASTDQMIKDIAALKGRLPSVIRTVLDVTRRDIPEELLRRLAPRGREGDAQVRSQIMSRYSQTVAFQKFTGHFSDPGELAYMTYDEMKGILMRKDELMNQGLSEADALAQIAQEKKDASARTAEELAKADPNFGAATATPSEPKNTRQGSLNGYRPATMASVFGGPAWGELLKKVVAGEAVPDRAALAALLGGEGQANITKFGVNAIAALGQGAQGYKTFQTAYDRLKSLGAVKLAGEYMKAAAEGGVLNNEYGNAVSTRVEQAQAGQINNPLALLGVLTDYQSGQLGKKGVQSVVHTAGVKGLTGVLQEIDRRNAAIRHAPADERAAMSQQLQEYMAKAAAGAKFGKESTINPEALEEMGKAAARVTDHLGKFQNGLKEATELVGKNQLPKGLGKLKSDYDTISALVKAADRGDSGAQGVLNQYGDQNLRGLATDYGRLDDQMKRAMLEGKGEFNPDGPLSKRLGTFMNEMTSGFELFRMQRIWGMTGAATFNKFIPAAAQDALTLATASRVVGGDRVGPISGMAGEMLQAAAARRDIDINAGKRAYQAWGPFVNANAGWFSEAQAVAGPAAGAGLMTGFGVSKLASLLGAGTMAGPIGLLAGAMVGGAGLYLANSSIRSAESKFTPDNQLIGARGAVESNLSLAEARQQMAEHEATPQTQWWTWLLSDFGSAAQIEQRAEWQAKAGRLKNTVAGLEKISGKSLSEMSGEFIQPTIEMMAKQSANQGMFIGYDQEAMKKKIQAVAPYDADLMGFKPISKDKFQATDLMNRLEASALGYDNALQLAQNVAGKYNSSASGVAGVARNMPTDMRSILDYMYKTELFAPAQQWGMTPDQAANMPLLEGRDALRAQKLMAGDQTAWHKTGQELWNQGVRDLGGGHQLQEVFTSEGETSAPVGQTDVSKRSSKAITAARSVMGLRSGQFGIRTDGSNLLSIAQYEAQKRDQEYGYQMQQFGFQNQALQAQWDYAMGRPATAGHYEGSTFVPGKSGLVGSFGWQAASAGESLRHTQAQAQIQAGTLNFSYLGQGLSVNVQNASLSALGQAGLQYRQFYENMDLNRRQSAIGRNYAAEDAQIAHDRGMVQLNWQRYDLGVNYNRQVQDIAYQTQGMAINYSHQQTQYGWQQQQIAFQGNQQALSFGWGMEDIDEAMRYATGRDRRRLARQRERSTIQYGMGVEQLNTEAEHAQQRMQWETDAFNREMEHANVLSQRAAADFEKDRGRLDQRGAWLDEDLARALARLAQQSGLEEEAFALKVKQFEEDMALSKTSHEENLKNALTMAGIQAGSAAEAKAQFEETWKRNKEEAAAAQTNYELMRNTMGGMALATTSASIQASMFAYNLGNPLGAVNLAFNAFINNMVKEFNNKDSALNQAQANMIANWIKHFLDSIGL